MKNFTTFVNFVKITLKKQILKDINIYFYNNFFKKPFIFLINNSIIKFKSNIIKQTLYLKMNL